MVTTEHQDAAPAEPLPWRPFRTVFMHQREWRSAQGWREKSIEILVKLLYFLPQFAALVLFIRFVFGWLTPFIRDNLIPS